MTQRRLRQANLMGPAGFVSIDDSEVMAFVQQGAHQAPEASGVIEMDGARWEAETPHAVTEGEIRAMYAHYRKVMGL